MASVAQELRRGEEDELEGTRWIDERSVLAKVTIESLLALFILAVASPIILPVVFLVRITSRGRSSTPRSVWDGTAGASRSTRSGR